MEQEWRASVTVGAVRALRDEQYEELHRHFAGVIRHEAAGQRLHLLWRLDAPSLVEAAHKALNTAVEGLGAAMSHEPQLIDLRVVTAEQANAERDYPREQELMGYREAAEELDVSRQRVAQLDGNHPDFPRPIGRTGAGPVFTAESIRSFAARWDRSPGRRKTA
ncbi:hypothetical protein [Streptomyces sp. NBC_00670]|uniref:hypothetical protein n=1 Tax=Streptomyces sp. NBC_00670 TaxID=2975804 RepID=UPI002E2F4731|nr:hypothetical protein [Streptomyces sp. NBC_00670]